MGQSALIAQISRPGTPPAFGLAELQQDIPFERMPAVDVEQLRAEDQIFDTIRDIPWRFGEVIYVDYANHNSGRWLELPGGDRVWQLGIMSPGALSINLTFDRYRLPEGASLYVYSPDRSRMLGAFTADNNQDDLYFATTLIEGDAVIVEYHEPATAAFPGELRLESVTHGYRGPYDYMKLFGQSGWCNLNVACDEANGWEDQINSAVMLVVGSSGFCSGALINNTAFDGTPLVLSANHCFRNPATVVFWFNWQSETCANPPVSPPHDAMSGAVTRARNAASDFWLLQLNQEVPESYNPFFAGWNRVLDQVISETIIGVHHPSGDIKKFSYSTTGVQAAAYGGGPGSGSTHWRIQWSGGTTTEGGSSGSPIFDSQGRIIGQLHGGGAACGNTLPDWYGRLGISWTGGGSQTTRLSDWLDPLGTNAMAIPGHDPFGEVIEDPQNFTATALNYQAIQLDWNLNEDGQQILIAVNSENSFGNPAGAYYLGQTISGGGQVIYIGDEESFVYDMLQPQQTYYFRAWSFSQNLRYSEGVDASAQTPQAVVQVPVHESFETPALPLNWSNEAVNGVLVWQFGQGNGAGHPQDAWQGAYNAYFKATAVADYGNSARLISPMLAFGDFELGSLRFRYANAAQNGLQDVLRVLYRQSPDDNQWVELAQLSTDTPEWTLVELALPSVEAGAQIAFEATAHGGHGVCVDAIGISGNFDADFSPPQNLTATVQNQSDVLLQWAAPEGVSGGPQLSAYYIYRNDTLIAVLSADEANLFTDEALPVGTHVYEVAALYQMPEGLSARSNEAVIEIAAAPVQYTLTVSIQGEGSVNPPAGSYSYNEGTQVTLEASPATYSVFSNWRLNGTNVGSNPQLSIVMNQNHQARAIFVPVQHNVSLASMPEGIGNQQGAGSYAHGQTAQISTNVPTGYNFLHWKEGESIVSTATAFQAVIESDRVFTAHFAPKYFDISLEANPVQGGSVSGGGNFAFGTPVTVEAQANEGYTFLRWEENGQLVSSQAAYQFTVSGARDLVARFQVKTYSITAQIQPQGSGTIAGAGSYAHGSTATLTAVTYQGWTLSQWEENGEAVSADNPYSFTVSGPRSLIARLEPSDRVLTIVVEGEGTTVPAPGTHDVHVGDLINLSATAAQGWHFVEWIVGDQVYTQPAQQIEITGDMTATARFEVGASVTDQSADQGLKVFPNPTRNRVNISLQTTGQRADFYLYNVSGQQLGHAEGIARDDGFTASFDLSGLARGVYIIRALSGDAQWQQRLLID